MPKNRTTAARSAIRRGAITLPAGRAGFTPAEVADALAVSVAYVYTLMERGELVSFHLGRARRITADSLADLIARQVAAEDKPA
jgi:excisionase family DNA binding protein